jgi:ligand-binding SRPBCC domain-containing protein
MFTLRATTVIHAPIDRCFQLSTSLAIVEMELGMTPVAGGSRTSGLVQLGDTIRWEGRKFGLHQFHVSLIDRYEFPTIFRDRMIEGRFRSFEHDHAFTETPEGTRLDDELRFTMPYGPLGWLVGQLIMVPHINRLLRRRYDRLQQLLEGDGWREYLPS